MITVHNFSNGALNPALGYAMSCVGAFLGLRCVTLARAYDGIARARWLGLAAVSIGATGIWAMHFIAMLGFTIPGQQILYNVPMTTPPASSRDKPPSPKPTMNRPAPTTATATSMDATVMGTL